MNIHKFNSLISLITNKSLFVNCSEVDLEVDYLYEIYEKIENEDKIKFAFDFKTSKNIDRFLSTFITQFCNKYKEQLDEFKDKKHYTLSHHLKSKYILLEEIKSNFKNEDFLNNYSKFGFYSTNYGIGIFTQYLSSDSISKIADQLSDSLIKKSIPFFNELSKKEYVYRWVINLSKEIHYTLIPN